MTRRTRLNPPFSQDDGNNRLRRPSKNTVTICGDSIAEWGSSAFQYGPLMGDMYMNHLCMAANQRMRFAGQYATKGGYSLSQIQNTLLPMVLAANPSPGACIISGGTNDALSSLNLAASTAALRGIAASLLRAGIAPILVTIPPYAASAAYIANFNNWVRRFAGANGFALIDMYKALAGSNGDYASATLCQGDNLHPSPLGHRTIAAQAIADGLADMFPPNASPLTSRSTIDLSNMLNNGTINQGLFTVDTNADGIADGLTAVSGTSTNSLVAPTTSDDLVGNWQQMQRTTGATGTAYLLNIFSTSNWGVGDVIALSARVQTSGIGTTQTPWSTRLTFTVAGGYPTPVGSVANLWHGVPGWLSDEDGLIYVEAPVPAGATAMQFEMVLGPVANAGTAQLRVGEATIVNLSRAGLLV